MMRQLISLPAIALLIATISGARTNTPFSVEITSGAGAPAVSVPALQKGDAIRFQPVEIIIDSGNVPLAAYQIELRDLASRAKIVGIEGGEHDAFAKPPYYDPKALMEGERIILAAFSTNPADALPHDETRIATVHLQITGNDDPELEVTVHTAATTDGNAIDIQAFTRLGTAR